MSNQKKQSTEAAVREIRRRSRRKFSPEEKIRIVLEGLRGEQSVSELCRREGIASNLYYRWSKDFLEAGKKQLAGDAVREAKEQMLHSIVLDRDEVAARDPVALFPKQRDLVLPCLEMGAHGVQGSNVARQLASQRSRRFVAPGGWGRGTSAEE
jgi:transposase